MNDFDSYWCYLNGICLNVNKYKILKFIIKHFVFIYFFFLYKNAST